MSIGTALKGEKGSKFTVKGVVTLVDGKNVYLQDSTGGICIYLPTAPTDVEPGDTLIANGELDFYNGLPELKNGGYEKSEGLNLWAKKTTIDALTSADVGKYINLTGVKVVEVFDNNGAYTTPNITVEDANGNKIQIYKAVIGKNADGSWSIKVGDTINVNAAVGIYNETLQLRNTYASEIADASSIPATGDTTISVVFAAMVASAMGVVALISKKKD